MVEKIRRAKKSDLKQYVKLRKINLKEYSKIIGKKPKIISKQIEKEFKDSFSPKRFILIAEEELIKGYLIGTLMTTPYTKKGYIDDIFVLQNLRQNNIGSSLIKEFIKMLKKRGIRKFRLGVNLKNEKALKLYKKLGFKITHYEMEKNVKE